MWEVGERRLIEAEFGNSNFRDLPAEGGSQNVEIRRKDTAGSEIFTPQNSSTEGDSTGGEKPEKG